jgi:hypothetical protein
VLNSFSNRCARSAANDGTRSHACSSSDWTANHGTGYATSSSSDGCPDGHARHIITQIARTVGVIFP